jgi:hypothetical protein
MTISRAGHMRKRQAAQGKKHIRKTREREKVRPFGSLILSESRACSINVAIFQDSSCSFAKPPSDAKCQNG